MYCCLNSRNLPTTELKTAQCFLNVRARDHQDFLKIILSVASPIPIGDTPGCWSRAISRYASRGSMELGSTSEEHILLTTMAREVQRSLDAAL